MNSSRRSHIVNAVLFAAISVVLIVVSVWIAEVLAAAYGEVPFFVRFLAYVFVMAIGLTAFWKTIGRRYLRRDQVDKEE